MGDYEHSTSVTADPDELFAYLSDVHNLPDYFARMREAEPAGGDAVHTVAEVEGHRVEGEAWFTTDDAARTIRWGAEGPNHYSGELEVSGGGGESQVTVRLHTERDEDGTADDRIAEGLEETLATIKDDVEGHGRANPS